MWTMDPNATHPIFALNRKHTSPEAAREIRKRAVSRNATVHDLECGLYLYDDLPGFPEAMMDFVQGHYRAASRWLRGAK